MAKQTMNNVAMKAKIYFLLLAIILGVIAATIIGSKMGVVWQPAFQDKGRDETRDEDRDIEQQRTAWQSRLDHQLVKVTIETSDGSRSVGKKELSVELVNTPASVTQGLSGRERIGSDGMLFIFPTKEVRHFWMKDMQFDLDLVWIADGVVVGVTEQASKPTPGMVLSQLLIYSSPQPVDMVLEVPAGGAKKWELEKSVLVFVKN